MSKGDVLKATVHSGINPKSNIILIKVIILNEGGYYYADKSFQNRA